MRKAAIGITIFCAAVIFFAVSQPGSRIVNSPLTQQISAMRQIGLKLRQYDLDNSATATDSLKAKSIDDLVAMNVLSPSDAAYLHDHQITFRGYDPARIGGDIPLLEGIFSRGTTRKRIVCYSDISVVTSPPETTK